MSLRNQQGFTLIELLVVILILGILAAIALPLFIGQSEKAKDAEAKQLASNVERQAASCFVEQSSWTKCDDEAELPKSGLKFGTAAGEVLVEIDPYGMDAVAFIATSKTGTVFALVHPKGERTKQRVCLVPSNKYPTGACRAGGPIPGFGRW